jgi:hypothetical protein
MSFIVSLSRFTSSDQLPRANDENIQIVERANTHDMACITFIMSMSTEKNAAKEKELREAAARDGIQLSTNRSDVLYFGYNAPYTFLIFEQMKSVYQSSINDKLNISPFLYKTNYVLQ